MATQKLSEVGWFYHAPPKRPVNPEPIALPATSQIPGLNQQYDPDEFTTQPREMIFKDTDTKYIRLAKEGGRKDLLSFSETKKLSSEPKGYPRVNWFYLEDNRHEDEQEAKKKDELNWQFMLPEYMVHEPYEPSTGDGIGSGNSRKRVPFAQDNMSVFQRDTTSATDKTVKIDNDLRQGYGVRNRKPVRGKKPPKYLSRTVKLLTPKEQLIAHKNIDWNRDGPDAPRLLEENQRPAMDKLLSNAYGHCTDTWDVSPPLKDRRKPKIKELGPISKNNKKDDKGKEKKGTEEKELFKLSRFKNIPSKIDSFQQLKEVV